MKNLQMNDVSAGRARPLISAEKTNRVNSTMASAAYVG
jgi:hypothetical protein